MHSGFAKLHADGLFRLCGLNSQTNYTNIEAVSLTAAARISAFSQLSPRVKLGKSAATLHQPINTDSEAPKSSFLCNWRVDAALSPGGRLRHQSFDDPGRRDHPSS